MNELFTLAIQKMDLLNKANLELEKRVKACEEAKGLNSESFPLIFINLNLK